MEETEEKSPSSETVNVPNVRTLSKFGKTFTHGPKIKRKVVLKKNKEEPDDVDAIVNAVQNSVDKGDEWVQEYKPISSSEENNSTNVLLPTPNYLPVESPPVDIPPDNSSKNVEKEKHNYKVIFADKQPDYKDLKSVKHINKIIKSESNKYYSKDISEFNDRLQELKKNRETIELEILKLQKDIHNKKIERKRLQLLELKEIKNVATEEENIKYLEEKINIIKKENTKKISLLTNLKKSLEQETFGEDIKNKEELEKINKETIDHIETVLNNYKILQNETDQLENIEHHIEEHMSHS
jgi:hypothetical protein